jgi:predicted nucleic acid-binding protein
VFRLSFTRAVAVRVRFVVFAARLTRRGGFKIDVARPSPSSFCTACSAMYHGAAVVARNALTAPGL